MSMLRVSTGETLHSYCVKNKICYNNVWRKIEEGLSIEDAIQWAISRKGRKDYNRKHFYKGNYVGDLLGGWKSVYHKRFLSEYRRTKNLEQTLAKYIDITKVVEK